MSRRKTNSRGGGGGVVDVEVEGVDRVAVTRATDTAETDVTPTPPVTGTASGSSMNGDRAMQVGKY